jgi:hypothetical protein
MPVPKDFGELDRDQLVGRVNQLKAEYRETKDSATRRLLHSLANELARMDSTAVKKDTHIRPTRRGASRVNWDDYTTDGVKTKWRNEK